MKRLISALALLPLLLGCGDKSEFSSQGPAPSSNQNQDQGPRIQDFAPLQSSDFAMAKQEVLERDLRPRNVALVHVAEYNEDWMVGIYEHEVQGNLHYGAVAYPKLMPEPRRMVVLADGLQQFNPTMSIEGMLRHHIDTGSMLNELVYLIPGFRGRALLFDDEGWQSGGDFCDAYDGAASDTIAFINVIAREFEDVIDENYLIMGGSRGGNTALLVANRDERVAMAIATASPVDFYQDSVLDNYGSQYYCQFINGKNLEQSRNRILNSSPYHFAQDAHGRIRIHQGELDTTVPEWNAYAMHRALRHYAKNARVSVYDGKTHGSIWSDSDWQAEVNDNIAEYFQYLDSL